MSTTRIYYSLDKQGLSSCKNPTFTINDYDIEGLPEPDEEPRPDEEEDEEDW